MPNKLPCEINGVTGEVSEYPQRKGARYRAKLDSLADIKREMCRLYRETRGGLLDVHDAARLTFMLQQIGKITMDSDIESRLEILEGKQK